MNKDPAQKADFLEVQSAHNNAFYGDTILVEGYYSYYSQLTVTKLLYIFGPGYFLDENPETQVSTDVAHINFQVNFNAGSEGSVFSGFTVHDIIVNTSDITICGNVSVNNTTEFIVNGSASNIIIEKNYIWSRYGALQIGGKNIIVRNNYIEDELGAAISVTNTGSVTFYNNVIKGDINTYYSVLNNNILIEGAFTGINTIFNNNISNSDQFGTENGNQAHVIIANLFVGASGNSTDGQWQLQPASQAIGAGINGEDCGMFGGSTPYVLSGLPAIPAIFLFDATSSGGIDVHLEAKTH